MMLDSWAVDLNTSMFNYKGKLYSALLVTPSGPPSAILIREERGYIDQRPIVKGVRHLIIDKVLGLAKDSGLLDDPLAWDNIGSNKHMWVNTAGHLVQLTDRT